MKISEILKEYNVIGSAVRKDEIPKEYQNYPVIGRGATSIVLDKGDTVLIFTRDNIKVEWLTRSWGLSLGKYIDEYEIKSKTHIRSMGEFPIYIIEMPKLYPLSNENKRKVKKEIEKFEELKWGNMHIRNDHEKFTKIYNYYMENEPDSIIVPVLDFLSNYDAKQYGFDFLMRNFLQDSDGNIIPVDPVVSKDIYDCIMANKRCKVF